MEIERLCTVYLPLIKLIASRYTGRGVPFEDLVQEGLMGIIEAEKIFDASKGTSFSTYAIWWIKKKILESIRNEEKQSLNALPLSEAILEVSIEKKSYGCVYLDELLHNKFLSSLEQKILKLHFREGMTLDELSRDLGIKRERVRQIKHLLIRKIKKLTED